MNGVAALLLSAVGGKVCVDGREDEIIISAIADGVCKPGYAVTVINTAGATQGDIAPTDINADDRFVGILLPTYAQDCDAIITDGDICEIVIPQKGHTYNVYCIDGNVDWDIGCSVTFGAAANDGRFLVEESTIEVADYIASLSKYYNDNDLIMEIIWRA